MDELYQCKCPSCQKIRNEDTADYNLTEEEQYAILRLIYDRELDVSADIQRDLWQHTRKFLDDAVDQAFALRIEENKDFIEELKYNNAVFAAFKTHREQNDLAAMLVDENGKPRSFNNFRKATTPVLQEYNVNWLQTEYLTAIHSARTAELFKRFERDRDLFPNVRWMPSRAVEPREAHRIFYYQVRSLDDPWWLTHYPGCLWRCQCDVENTADPITHRGEHAVAPGSPDVEEGQTTTSPGLEQNPAFTGSLFSKSHPYVVNAYPGAKDAVARFMVEEGKYTVIPTEQGLLRIHSGHGKGEREENIRIGSYLANKYGYEIDLLDNPDGVKSADSYNHTLRVEQEYKQAGTPTKNAIDRLIRDAAKQADDIVLWIETDMDWEDIGAALRSRVRRSESIRSVTLIREGKDIRLSRVDILQEGFKIRPADLT